MQTHILFFFHKTHISWLFPLKKLRNDNAPIAISTLPSRLWLLTLIFPQKGPGILAERNVSRSEVRNIHYEPRHLVLEDKEAIKGQWVKVKDTGTKRRAFSTEDGTISGWQDVCEIMG